MQIKKETSKSVAIVTILGENQGNRLQNYALQRVLEKNCVKVETLKNLCTESQALLDKTKRTIKKCMSIYLPKMKKERQRHLLFNEFDRRYIKYSKYKLWNEKIPVEITQSYDYFICGSDQIWNPNYPQNGCVNFLGFVEAGKKSSYAASMGAEYIPEERKKEFSVYINDLDNISVREAECVSILQEMTNKSIEVNLDPTLLLNDSEWAQLEKKPNVVISNKRYVLVYFLGTISKEASDFIKAIKDREKIEIIDIHSDEWYGFIGPSEFLYLIHNCDYVVTDSFHGTVFSIIYQKEFYVFPRDGIGNSMGGRIVSLLEIVDLSERYLCNSVEEKGMINYSVVEQKLTVEKKKSLRYIEQIISQI
ncbi:polysaccharide pyruvyl transferase family protein [Clostridium polynesiense]|uniref:polysaccharide pyruvyl transferase family protein n=1 Tax=Clostridium polynesiense TaxID=1325933 RepID=UPI00058D83CA|nr:polysaccharide pyruvyl transferase family protein [Clostridium polynesiense]